MKYIILIFTFFIFSCKKESVNSTYNNLKPGETKVVIEVDNSPFYMEDAIFKGNYQLTDKVFNLNIMDQYGSNIMIHNYEDNWADKSKKIIKPQLVGDYASSLMVGRVKDKAQNLGEGYLFTDGQMEIKELSKEKILIEIKGEMKKYPNVKENDKSYPIKGYIVSKNPEFSDSTLF